jgi:hypothetical protein
MKSRLRNLFNEVANFGSFQRAWHGPGKIIWQRGRAKCFGITTWKMSTTPRVLNLAKQTAILAFYCISEAFKTIRIILPPNLYPGQM